MWEYIALPNTAMTNIQHDERWKALIQQLTAAIGFSCLAHYESVHGSIFLTAINQCGN